MADGKTPYKLKIITRTYLSGGTNSDGKEVSDQIEKKKMLLDPASIKAFLAGVVVSHLSKNMVLGLIVGTLSGIFVQQNYPNVPNVKNSWKDFLRRFKESRDK